MIIAVDFDGTLKKDGQPNTSLIQSLILKQRQGNAIILWTCRQGQSLKEALSFCMNHGLVFNAVNENLPQAVKMMWHNSRKIYADVYIDDKAVKI